MKDILAEICEAKRDHVRRKRRERSESALLSDAKHASTPRGFRKALEKAAAEGFGLIAEIKKASPSKGLIRADFHPERLAEAYAEGGAACLSVLTDEPYFQGHDDYLQQARTACPLPVLRKDFMLEPYQIVESRALEADCVLLIMAALSDAQYAELHACADALGMDALVEVHDREELDRALKHAQPRMTGINNRSLRTFETDLSVTETLAKHMPEAMLKISESGIFTHDDLKRLEQSGIRSFLVGESLMRQKDVTLATRQLLGT